MGQTLVRCQYPGGSCDYTYTGEHVNNGEQETCGACGAEPPEGYDEWKMNDLCEHEWCRDADKWRREYEAGGKPLSQAEREEILSDTELMRDEFHGGHAIMATGFNEDGTLRVRDSWG